MLSIRGKNKLVLHLENHKWVCQCGKSYKSWDRAIDHILWRCPSREH